MPLNNINNFIFMLKSITAHVKCSVSNGYIRYFPHIMTKICLLNVESFDANKKYVLPDGFECEKLLVLSEKLLVVNVT